MSVAISELPCRLFYSLVLCILYLLFYVPIKIIIIIIFIIIIIIIFIIIRAGLLSESACIVNVNIQCILTYYKEKNSKLGLHNGSACYVAFQHNMYRPSSSYWPQLSPMYV